MRGKRSKQYRKLMQQYSLTFGFREPYQVVVDAEMIHDTHRFAMDLAPALARTLHGDVKVMITQCSIRHLYGLPTTTASNPSGSSTTTSSSSSSPSSFLTTPIPPDIKTRLLEIARTFTLRRCGHHKLPEPLSPLACLGSVLDPKGSGTNAHRLILGVQHAAVRAWARTAVRGVPAVYVKRSVMVMEPMSALSVNVREGWERGKIVRQIEGTEGQEAGGRNGGVKEGGRGEDSDDEEDEYEAEEKQALGEKPFTSKTMVRKRKRGPKGPNPLSVKKKKTTTTTKPSVKAVPS